MEEVKTDERVEVVDETVNKETEYLSTCWNKTITAFKEDSSEAYISEFREDVFNDIGHEMMESKKELNTIFGLSIDGNFRRLITIPQSEEELRNRFSETTKFYTTLADGKEFSYLKNTIKVNNQEMKLTRYIGKEIEKRKLKEPMSTGSPEYHIQYLYYESFKELNYPKDYVGTMAEMVKGKKLCISTNIYDFFTSSTNSVGYTSCYGIDGWYFSGNISYMRDNFTIQIFSYIDNIDVKHGRTWAYIFPKVLQFAMPSKKYGNIFAIDKKKIRLILERDLAQYLNVEDRWKVRTRTYSEYYSSGCTYFDNSEVYHVKHKDSEMPTQEIKFLKAVCLSCGCKHTNSEHGLCEDCDTETITCYSCEVRIDGDNDYEMNGNYYCRDCFNERFSYCDECEEYHDSDDVIWSENLQRSLCDNCRDDYYYCEECYDYFKSDDITCGDNRSVCHECMEKEALNICEECNRIVLDFTYVEECDITVCSRCITKYDQCSECEEYGEDMESHNDKLYCKDCIERNKHEA